MKSAWDRSTDKYKSCKVCVPQVNSIATAAKTLSDLALEYATLHFGLDGQSSAALTETASTKLQELITRQLTSRCTDDDIAGVPLFLRFVNDTPVHYSVPACGKFAGTHLNFYIDGKPTWANFGILQRHGRYHVGTTEADDELHWRKQDDTLE